MIKFLEKKTVQNVFKELLKIRVQL